MKLTAINGGFELSNDEGQSLKLSLDQIGELSTLSQSFLDQVLQTNPHRGGAKQVYVISPQVLRVSVDSIRTKVVLTMGTDEKNSLHYGFFPEEALALASSLTSRANAIPKPPETKS